MATSLDLYLPFDAGAGANVTEDNWRKMARFWLGTGPLKSEDNEMQVYADSTGMQVKVKTGKCWIRGHYGELSVEKILPVAAAHATLGRIDLVVARADFVNNRIEVDVITGVPSGGPVAPAVTQSAAIWEIALATITVDAAVGTIAAGKVTDARVLVAQPSTISPWTAYVPTLVQSGAVTKTVTSARYQQVGKTVRAQIVLAVTGAGGVANNPITIGLPVAAAVAGLPMGSGYLYDASAVTAYPGLAQGSGTGGVTLVVTPSTLSAGQTGSPMAAALAAGDFISLMIEYEAA